jgi:hypothetical protein
MDCCLCDTPIDVTIHGYMQLPCKHVFHIRCGLASCNKIYSTHEHPQCRVCTSSAAKENTIIPPTNLMNMENVISLEEAYTMSETKYLIDKTTKLDEKIKGLKPEDIQFWKDYIELSKEEFRLYKARNLKAWRIGKEFKAEVSHLTALYNKSFRKYYKQLLETNECNEYKVIGSKTRKMMRQFDRYFEEYIDPYDLTIIQFLQKIGLLGENEQVSYLSFEINPSFVSAFNEFDKLYDKKNIFKK